MVELDFHIIASTLPDIPLCTAFHTPPQKVFLSLHTQYHILLLFSVGENDEYEEYVEQVITTPVDSEQLKAIHTNYPTTVLTSENEISVEYVADTEAYIGKRIKEENQSLQKQILEIQSALISQKISGV